jgi:hypothetical protein
MHEVAPASVRFTMAAGGRPFPRAVGRPHYSRSRMSRIQDTPEASCKPRKLAAQPPANTDGQQA